MHIAILTDGIYPYMIGGMQKHSCYLARFLAHRGHEITLVHAIPPGQAIPSEEEVKRSWGEEKNNRIHLIGIHFPAAGNFPGHYLKESFLYSNFVFNSIKDRLGDFDFIYAKGFAAWKLFHQKSKGKKMPPIGVKFHGYEMFQQAADVKSKLQHFLLRKPVKWNTLHADVVFSYGEKITSIIRSLGVKQEKIIEIPTGIDASWFAEHIPQPSDKVHFVFIGRYERRKGIIELSEILQEVDFPGIFHFIGPIPVSRQIKKKNIIYHGVLSDEIAIRKILDTCQVMVVPSWSEGMPNVILEGMSRGLAIVATDVGAVKGLVNDENGWLIPAGNKTLLKETLLHVATINRLQLCPMQRASLLKVKQNFSWEIIAEKVEKAIEDSLYFHRSIPF